MNGQQITISEYLVMECSCCVGISVYHLCRLFSEEQYFDSSGFFIFVVLAVPVVFNCLLIVVGEQRHMYRETHTHTHTHTHQYKEGCMGPWSKCHALQYYPLNM